MKTVKIALLGLIFAGCGGKYQKERVIPDYSLPASEYKTRLAASDPGTWKPVTPKGTIPTAGVVPADNGLFKPALDLNASYLLHSFSTAHMLEPFRIRAGREVELDSVPQVRFWDTELRGSNAGRFLMGAGNTLRWAEYPELRARMNELIDGIEACREPNGYILPYHPDSLRSEEPNYARAWLTHGLIEAAIAGNPKAYGLLRGHADWFNHWDDMLPKLLYWNYNNHQGHIASTRTYLSPVGKPEDLQVAEKYYVCDWWMDGLAAGCDEAVWQYPLQNPHSYLITSFEAYLDHYLATGDKTYLDAMLGAWQMIHDKWEHPGGSIAICEGKWSADEHGNRSRGKNDHAHPPHSYYLTAYGHTGETCGSVFWIKFNQRFHRLFPDEEKYVAEIEKSIYNVILASQTEQGNIRYHANMQGTKENPRSASNTCCEGQGTRLLGSLPEYIYSIASDGLYVNLYEPSSINWTVRGQAASLMLDSDFPFESQIGLKIAVPSPVKMNIRVRIPSWATQKVEISVNGKRYTTGKPGSYVELSRKWTDGDRVDFTLPAGYRVTQYAGVDTVAGYERYAVEYGPILLASTGGDKAPHELETA
ncbi:MAG: glycoside hydrolase family 127 protein, partial [Tannerella sp.]|nr:glycoside hydrolase family 127 protein [Tannerella sp.]